MIDKLYSANIYKFLLLISLIINMLLGTFLPPNNSELNYRQLELSWPQIPNYNNYKITINDLKSDFSVSVNS